jgi:hypothetical protein
MILRLISHKRPGFTGCQSPAWLEVVLLVVMMMMVRWHLPALSGRAASIEWMRRRRTAIIRIAAISTVTRRFVMRGIAIATVIRRLATVRMLRLIIVSSGATTRGWMRQRRRRILVVRCHGR